MIIGITGTLGAGKGTVVDYLKKRGFAHQSVRAFLTEEIERRGIEVNRDSMVAVANELRQRYSPSYIVEQLYARAEAVGGDVVIESIRAIGEVEALRGKTGFFLLSIDADQKLRYERIVKRGSVTDGISFAQFQADEQREMTSTDPTKQNLGGVMKLADATIHNDGTFGELYARVDALLRDRPSS